MKIKPTDDDFRKACIRRYYIDWDRVKTEAIQIAAERLLRENQEETRRLNESNQRLLELKPSGAMRIYLENQDRLTNLFEEHDKLLDIAYPRSRKESK